MLSRQNFGARLGELVMAAAALVRPTFRFEPCNDLGPIGFQLHRYDNPPCCADICTRHIASQGASLPLQAAGQTISSNATL